MGTKVAITRTDHTGAELRALSAKCADGAQVRRMLALALVLDGRSRSEAAVLNGMDRQTLRDWVHRYNEAGIEGLKSRKSPGREPYLIPARIASDSPWWIPKAGNFRFDSLTGSFASGACYGDESSDYSHGRSEERRVG